ncbi:CDP-glycerol glycerophosphotransferase family protein [Quadrisphaera sp. DSM 44207]|uniref:CDP-glycerol glycerophosphotransferase family protein n=1 Tax=Quadrisphaera sp. DSM 44207 TaxID=1881057 RepID=UPI00087E6788|nr:CDP-glycerol glycerophosphotransferase family protein [Quadrisphaera sp. DSM 44207]SDQ67800.1 CDP-glycerol glycerophosphotransferase, TagB/SpsB family [Quadrisphaera sp. DSM 44207]
MSVLLALLQRCVLFPLSHLVPRRPGLWAFGAPQDGFSGNPKHLFLWVSEHRPDVRAVWLTGSPATRRLLREHGYRCELRWSLAGVAVAARAQWHVVANDASDTSLALSGGARLLNTWHGVGIKNILRGATVGANAGLYRRLWRPDVYLRSAHRFRRPALVLATSPTMAAHFARSFDIPIERCPQLGYPRLDALVDEDFRRLCLRFGDYDALRRRCAGRTVYLYAPTLRDDDADVLAEAVPDLAALSEALRPTGGLLLLKLHPFTAARVGEQLDAFDDVAVWPEGLDLYPVLDEVDCLITDYSSLLYDYIAVRDSGVVVYAYDYERYVAQDRDLALPFEENVTGQRADAFEQLCEVLRSGRALAALPPQELAALRTRFWGAPGPVRRMAGPAVTDFALAWPGPRRSARAGRWTRPRR